MFVVLIDVFVRILPSTNLSIFVSMITNKLPILTFLVFSILFSQSLLAQKGKIKAFEKYRISETLYVLKSDVTSSNFTSSDGKEISFLEEVKKNWPDKKVELISQDDYLALDDLENQFHLTYFKRTIAVGESSAQSTVTSEQHGLMLKNKSTELGEGKIIASLWMDYEGIKEGLLTERLIHSIMGVRKLVDEFDKKAYKIEKVIFMSNCEETISSKTLLVKQSLLPKKLTKEKLESIYDYKFEIVSDDKWEEAVSTRKDNCIYMDQATGGRFTSINVFTTEGDLLINSYPWTGANFKTDKKFFQEIFDF